MSIAKPHMDVFDRGWYAQFTPGTGEDPYPSTGNPLANGAMSPEQPLYIRHINLHGDVTTADSDTTIHLSVYKNGSPSTGTLVLETTHSMSSTGTFSSDTEGFGLVLPSDDVYVWLHATTTGTKGGVVGGPMNWSVLSEPVGLTRAAINRNVTVMDSTYPRLKGATNPTTAPQYFFPVGMQTGEEDAITAGRSLRIWFSYFTCDVQTADLINAKMNQTLYVNGISALVVNLSTNTTGPKKSSKRGPITIGGSDTWSVGWEFSGSSSALVRNLFGYMIGEWI
jgi:hypothetical protein